MIQMERTSHLQKQPQMEKKKKPKTSKALLPTFSYQRLMTNWKTHNYLLSKLKYVLRKERIQQLLQVDMNTYGRERKTKDLISFSVSGLN